MKTIPLNGQWALRQNKSDATLPATVPGDVYLDLINAGRIPDPFYRDNENSLQWIGEADWTYSRTFRVPAAFLKHDGLVLRCEGLDTFASITINGHTLATTDNMYRTWEWDVRPLLKEGENRIEILFRSTIPYIQKRHSERPLPTWNKPGQEWVRKEPCNYGWDWGTKAVTCGIWRKIELVGYNTARIDSVLITQDHSSKGNVGLGVALKVDRLANHKLTANVKVIRREKVVVAARATLSGATHRVDLCIAKPELWWPNNMGDQPLYTLVVELSDAEGTVLDTTTKRIGLRTLRLDRHKDEWGESFQFVANGIPFFAKGANWIPADGVLARMTPQRYRKLVEDAAAVHMNMLRVWGGGIYEDDSFYDACDELGICVWQDFMFACSAYPTFDDDFMATVKEEARDNIQRLRHHPSIALWCGNNELEGCFTADKWTSTKMSWKSYGKLFDTLLPSLLAKLDPQRDYVPGSPYSPCGDRADSSNANSGDAHLWAVWHGKQPFEYYRTCGHRFNSEFGFQSFPEPKTVRGYTTPRDRNVTSRVMEHHQRSGIGNTTIMTYMLDWFLIPEGFENTLWVSQILQGMAITYACEHWRRSMPRGMGTLYWQFNDTWPVASWSSIDYHGRWKALHYMARKFFEPVLISGLEDSKKGTVEIHVTSDARKTMPGTAKWIVTDLAGKKLLSGCKGIKTPSNGNRKIETLRLHDLVEKHGRHNLLVWLELDIAGRETQHNLVLFARPKQLDLSGTPGITAVVKSAKDGAFTVILKTKAPALWTWLELEKADASLSDNFFHLRPGKVKSITLVPEKPMTIESVRKQLIVRSLVDTSHLAGLQ